MSDQLTDMDTNRKVEWAAEAALKAETYARAALRGLEAIQDDVQRLKRRVRDLEDAAQQ